MIRVERGRTWSNNFLVELVKFVVGHLVGLMNGGDLNRWLDSIKVGVELFSVVAYFWLVEGTLLSHLAPGLISDLLV